MPIIGVRLRLVPSRTGAADLTLDQSWIVGDSEGVKRDTAKLWLRGNSKPASLNRFGVAAHG